MLNTQTASATFGINAKSEWSQIKQRRDILEIARYKKEKASEDELSEVNSVLDHLRKEELQNMRVSPSKYGKQHLQNLVDNEIFTYDELAAEGLITPCSWDKINLNMEFLPDVIEIQKASNQQALNTPDGTDVYFFGMPSSGKTSLLMGIAAANGQGYTLDMRTNGGPYAAALRQYAHAGKIPGRTLSKFVTTVGGNIYADSSHGHIHTYPINLVEMSGEEFALRIADSKETSIANMGTGATNMLRNNNRKVFFIVVDASRPMVKVSYLEREIDEDGDTSHSVNSRYVSQLDILDKFIVLMGLPENRDIMEKVDAIHFIVTKGESLGEGEERDQKARELIESQYLSVVEQLKNYSRNTHRINRNFDYEPQVLTYSLGKFYVGDVFDYDCNDALKIVDAIRDASTTRHKHKWSRFVNTCRMMLF